MFQYFKTVAVTLKQRYTESRKNAVTGQQEKFDSSWSKELIKRAKCNIAMS